MEREKLIAKFNMKDYNKELEKILAKKAFSKDTKNLLLSMLYKVENSYEDYKRVKVDVLSKKELIENLLRIIEQDCQEIEFIKPSLEENSLLKNEVIKEKHKIITYQNELSVIQALYKLDSQKFNVQSSDEIKSKALSELLNKGQIEQNSEIIRDFDGWSWNIAVSQIEDYISNLIFQGMVYLLGFENINQIKTIKLVQLEELLEQKYKQTLGEKIFNTINKIAILKSLEIDSTIKAKILNIKQELDIKLKLMEDKKKYIDEISQIKKEYIKKIEEIDQYMNNDLKLKKEYIKQNQILSPSERFFSLSDFSESIEQKKKDLKLKIDELTQGLKPKNYVKEKSKIEKNLKLINELNIEEPKIENEIYEFLNLLLKCLSIEINSMESKKDVLEKMYILRYLNLFYINGKEIIGKKYNKLLQKIEQKIIIIGCNLKILNIFSKNVKENYEIYKNIFKNQIIELESINIEISKENNLKIYDENSLEIEEHHNEFKELIVKRNKQIKIFL